MREFLSNQKLETIYELEKHKSLILKKTSEVHENLEG